MSEPRFRLRFPDGREHTYCGSFLPPVGGHLSVTARTGKVSHFTVDEVIYEARDTDHSRGEGNPVISDVFPIVLLRDRWW